MIKRYTRYVIRQAREPNHYMTDYMNFSNDISKVNAFFTKEIAEKVLTDMTTRMEFAFGTREDYEIVPIIITYEILD